MKTVLKRFLLMHQIISGETPKKVFYKSSFENLELQLADPDVASDPKIDQLREKMTIIEDERYTRDHDEYK